MCLICRLPGDELKHDGRPPPFGRVTLYRAVRTARRSRPMASPPIRVAIVAAGARGAGTASPRPSLAEKPVVQANGSCQTAKACTGVKTD